MKSASKQISQRSVRVDLLIMPSWVVGASLEVALYSVCVGGELVMYVRQATN